MQNIHGSVSPVRRSSPPIKVGQRVAAFQRIRKQNDPSNY